ncbi:MAG: hypothetical protein KC519_08760, partial [Anaerolineae bacterium]|nr:hypothetical protein [Anaerolineae bacterium]
AHVVGLSLGGYIALALLDRHARFLDRVVISGVTFEPMPNRAWLKPQLALTSFLMKRRWFVHMQARTMDIPSDMQSAFTENLLATSMDAYGSIYREAADYAVPASLSRVNTPTLITAGWRETKIIVDAVGAIAHMMPNAQGCLAPGLDHGWNVQSPELFSAMVRAWITGTPLPAGLQMVH